MLAAMVRNIAIAAGQHIEASAPGRQVAARNGPPHPASPEQETLLFTTAGGAYYISPITAVNTICGQDEKPLSCPSAGLEKDGSASNDTAGHD